jgi:hypothetical protein
VIVEVSVTGEDGRPVSDLTIDDFEIRVFGRVQTISDIERISIPLASRPIDLDADLARRRTWRRMRLRRHKGEPLCSCSRIFSPGTWFRRSG